MKHTPDHVVLRINDCKDRDDVYGLFTTAHDLALSNARLLDACRSLVRECNMYLGSQDRDGPGEFEQPGDQAMNNVVVEAEAVLAKVAP